MAFSNMMSIFLYTVGTLSVISLQECEKELQLKTIIDKQKH